MSCEATAKIAIDCQKSTKIEKDSERTAETRRRGEDRCVPIWEMLRGGETHG